MVTHEGQESEQIIALSGLISYTHCTANNFVNISPDFPSLTLFAILILNSGMTTNRRSTYSLRLLTVGMQHIGALPPPSDVEWGS